MDETIDKDGEHTAHPSVIESESGDRLLIFKFTTMIYKDYLRNLTYTSMVVRYQLLDSG